MKGLDARLDRIEDKLDAGRRREHLKDAPLVITICEGDPIPDYPGKSESGKGPLVIVRCKARPPDEPISEGDRPFINAGSSIDSEAL